MRPVHVIGAGGLVFVAATSLMTLAPQAAPADQTAPFPAVSIEELDAAAAAAEESFLQIDPDAAPDLSGITPLAHPGNVPYRKCEKPEALKAVLLKPGSQLYARRRDMSAYLRMTNVLATRDCSCSGKLVRASAILAFEKKLMAKAGVSNPEELVTRPLYDEARTLRRQVEYLCGGES
ncbi:hypothetical protein RM190_22735 [Paracoccus sp. CPCC 101403]|uniref:Uncharacterized protein n=1 Tax=Paracoccus broussonetiae TaxID=3075834 RepID=A0ABU3EKQ6_9RHOB|nr:hypothetical protein [Paracoccus sp. CPCC 101403]MDT1064690.1 hypothetical protein [Paracoccus sp. CPCC 101403]